MYGWTGKRLRVYLTEGKIVKEDISEDIRTKYWGEQGLGVKVLFDELKPGTDPLSPENLFILGVGPLNGTTIPCSGRFSVTTKSPLTGAWGEGSGGGDFAPELKFAGYDQIIFHGKSPKPVYLWVNNDEVTLKDASHIWGRNTWETHYQIIKELKDPGIRSVCIGPAGENLVRIAVVTTDLCRTAGRGGLGAVMGSKNLKAVAVRGTGSVNIARPRETAKLAQDIYDKIMKSPHMQIYMEQGTLWLTRMTASGFLSTRNAQQGYFEGWEKLTAEVFLNQWATKHEACFACPISCGHYYEVKDVRYACHGKSPEFGALAKFTSAIGNDNMASALFVLSLCNKMGIDMLSCGNIIAFAMEAWQRKMITAEDTDNLDLSWGNIDSAIELVKNISNRQGIGNVLADGSRAVANKIKGSEFFLNEVKGLDWISMYPGANSEKGRVLAVATSTRGADHLKGYMDEMVGSLKLNETLSVELLKEISDPNSYRGRGALLALENNFRAATDNLGFCWFPTEATALGGIDHEDLAKVFSAVTGYETSSDEMLRVGERSYNLQRAFNIREGLGRKDDNIPNRYFARPGVGINEPGVDPVMFETMLDEYYEYHGWDKRGVPTKAKLEELGLGYMADQIDAR